MKFKKFYLKSCLTFMGVIGIMFALGANVSADNSQVTFSFDAHSNGTATITGFDDSDSHINEKISIPGTVNEDGQTYTVTKIGKESFEYSKIKAVELPDTVTTIGEDAFSWNHIVSFTAPKNLKVVGTEAFENNKIGALRLNKGLQHVYFGAFGYNRIKSVVLPASLQTIGPFGFGGNKIKSVRFNKELKKIGGYAFQMNKLNVHKLHINKHTKVARSAFEEQSK